MKSILYFFLSLFSISLSAQLPIYTNSLEECKLSQGWTFKTLNGNYGFNVIQDQISLFPNGTCLINYDQKNRSDIARRRFQLQTSNFTIGGYDRYFLVFNLQYLRPYNSTFNLYVNYGTSNILVRNFNTEIRDLTTQSVSVSIPTSATNVYFYFDYDFNGNDGGTKIILDDFIFSPDHGDCSRALPIALDKDCQIGHIAGSITFTPTQNVCLGDYSGAAWYKYTSDFTGLAKVTCSAIYNNALSIFEGSCSNMNLISCTNKDEIGFIGEGLEFNAIAGKTYFFRTARKINDFGTETGSHCISLKKISSTTTPPPLHDLCDQKVKVLVNGPCVQGINRNALTENRLPSLNQRSRADVWYEFTAISSKPHEIIPNANFADVITVYEGSCSNLTELVVADLGHKLQFTPVSGRNYIVQITGYFATIEGDLCLSVNEKLDAKPVHDICETATKITLNSLCHSSLFTTNNLSVKKPSCVIYNAPDVWYSFVAPTEKAVAISVGAGFIYHYAIYSGTCANLTEKLCGNMPDPCNGYIQVDNLIAGQTYYLQIISATNILKSDEAQLCVKIDELSLTQAFEPVKLTLQLDCLHGVLGQVNYTVEGGKVPVQYHGPASTELFLPGQKIEAFVEDANGCRSFANLETSCLPPTKCNNTSLTTDVRVECLLDSIGRQTGEVVLHVAGKGGAGVYYLYGTPDGSKLKHNDEYKVIVIDRDSCFAIEEGKINCPPFTCAQSALKVDVKYECIDSLLKAVLNVEVTGQLGNITLTGNTSGEFLNQGDSFKTSVTDEAGCQNEINGIIQCTFDSCVYARPALDVNYICIGAAPGQSTGRAILVVNGSSKAGGVHYIGHQPGDTLNDNDTYSVKLKDAFGCELETKGEIDCTISSLDPLATVSIGVQPNPSNGKIELSIQWPKEKLNSDVYLSVVSLQGLILQTKKVPMVDGINKHNLDLSNYQPGIYSIRLSSSEFNTWVKVLKL